MIKYSYKSIVYYLIHFFRTCQRCTQIKRVVFAIFCGISFSIKPSNSKCFNVFGFCFLSCITTTCGLGSKFQCYEKMWLSDGSKAQFVCFAWPLCLFWHNLSCLMVSLLQWLVNMKLRTQYLYCNIGRTQSPTPLSSTSCQIQSWIPPQDEEGGIAILNPFKWASTVFERRFWHNTPNVYPMDHNSRLISSSRASV